MNTSQYMDKQIMDLSNSQSKNEFIDLINPNPDYIGGGKKEEILPSYDFQQIHPVRASPLSNIDSSNVGGARVWISADSKINSGIINYDSLDSIEPGNFVLEKDRNVYDAALVSEIDRTMKKHADNLLHAIEGLNAGLSQLESRTRHIENSVNDLKVSVENNHGSTDGKMRQMEVIFQEVQTGIQVVRDNQEKVEAQLQFAKLQVSKVEQQSETHNTLHMDSVQQAVSAPLQSHHQLPPVPHTQPHPTPSPPNAPPPPSSLQNLPTSVQLPNPFSHNHTPPVSYFPPPGQTPEVPNQHYHLPPPQQQYQPPPHPQYSQSPPQLPPQQHPSLSPINHPQPQHQIGHPSNETPYIPSQNYPQTIPHPPSHPPSSAPPSQQFCGTTSHMYEPPSSRPSSGFSDSYGLSSGTAEQFTYGGSPSQYGSGSPMKSQKFSSPAVSSQSGGSGYPQLPTARMLPRALLNASGAGGESGSAGSGNRVPIDDVVDKVTTMGFSRDQVRATVRKLTENGQSVDLNVVLDKLMNDGDGQTPRGWYGR